MIKAIETEYNGYRFRSRLEARWAVFFDTLGLKYEYEKEGYDLDGMWYLPDFWLPELDCWVEIKGQKPTEEEILKMCNLTEITHKTGFILWGNIPASTDEQAQYNWCEYRYGYHVDDNRQWTACSICKGVDITFDGRGDYNSQCKGHATSKYLNWDFERINKAFTSARSARFEHGEKG